MSEVRNQLSRPNRRGDFKALDILRVAERQEQFKIKWNYYGLNPTERGHWVELKLEFENRPKHCYCSHGHNEFMTTVIHLL